MPRHSLAAASAWITPLSLSHGDDLVAALEQRLGVGRRRARALLDGLVQAGWLRAEGTRRRPRYRPGPLRQVVRRYPLAGLAEDRAWAEDFAPCLDLPPHVARLAQHAFTELVNNAVDHSGGQGVTVSLRQSALHLQMLVSDDGCGLFTRIGEHWQIDDPALAMLELGKGRLSTQPERHRGQGLFFVARAADIFDLHANHHGFQRRPGHSGWAGVRPLDRQGTSAYWAVALDTTRTLDEVLRSHADTGYTLDHAEVSLRLLAGGQRWLESRAQARRAAARLSQFSRAHLDFSGIDEVGPAFADELFRVYARAHPQVRLVPEAASPRVAAMIAAVTAA
jgi:anti-sigma regulatory factor (Ser/Thr protein kinase)